MNVCGCAVNAPIAFGHCCWTAWLGARTSARLPIRRISSTPSSVVPEPGGETMCVEVWPRWRPFSNAASAARW
jgi:hypothetical protein